MELLQYYKNQLEGKEPIKNNLLNKLFKRSQLKLQETVSKLEQGIANGYVVIDGYAEQLEDVDTIKSESVTYVEQQLENLKSHIQLLEKLDAIKGKLEFYNRRYVSPVQEQIKQTKIAIKSSNTMQEIHRSELKTNAAEIDDFLISRYLDKNLVDKLLNLPKNECTPEQWKTITVIKQHYNEYVAKNLDNLLV